MHGITDGILLVRVPSPTDARLQDTEFFRLIVKAARIVIAENALEEKNDVLMC